MDNGEREGSATNNTQPPTWDVRIPVDSGMPPGEPAFYSWNLELPESMEYSGLVFSFSGKLDARAEKSTEGRSFWVEINTACKGSVPCSRCLRETPLEITGTFRYFYTPSAEVDVQASDDEMTVTYPPDAIELDLSGQVWESLVMSLPGKVLCRDDCAGLCTKCGADLNLGPCGCPNETQDPRLQALRDILPGVSEE
jgi:uncharacterized protein